MISNFEFAGMKGIEMRLAGMFVIDATDALIDNSGIGVSIVHNFAGDNSVLLSSEWATVDTRFAAIPLKAIAASGLCAAGVSRPDATHVRITSGQEGAVGAASVLTSMDVLVLCFRLIGTTGQA